ncbi:hypothetical protein [Roseococcus pinisoli]|uniref:Uncharacterized protein n=1 Tax=Roseococcus pinisoli TaxID=2835040 RepID=A0ABS5QG91_9PROT|nr:hypothetical protein [Roseococcus pinisoli]MBS7812336.1 hypothetical protein [Roseococcus pinisoli]
MADVNDRIRELEQSDSALRLATAVHEAVCAERYRGITWRLNILVALFVATLGAAAAGNPVMQALSRIFTGS